jgi:hypothetical protein
MSGPVADATTISVATKTDVLEMEGTMWLIRFEHCSDDSCNVMKRARTREAAITAAAKIAVKSLDRCNDSVAEQIEAHFADANFGKVVDLFVQEQLSGGDCILEITELT